MVASARQTGIGRSAPLPLGWLALAALAAWVAAPVVGSLVELWQKDPSLSHGPIIPVIAAALLWQRRKHLKQWEAATPAGLAALGASSLVYVAAVWADIYFLKPLGLILMLMSGIWFLGGPQAARLSRGAVAFLVFMIPWPTTLTERLAFPLQLTSSAYAATLSGILGIPIIRDGVHLYVMPSLSKPPLYSIIVARQCSGLTSLMVLLALGYLVAYFTPAKIGWRTLLVAAVVPLTLFANSLRLTLILVAGTYHSAGLARWVHDHEAPVLVFFCSMGLLALRAGILAWLNREPEDDGTTHDGEAHGQLVGTIPVPGR
ncbi:MAG: exosortase [Armatimonadetes bacterium]|jgi:exosortase|nr:exosortase [Armatimonadota bacterium]